MNASDYRNHLFQILDLIAKTVDNRDVPTPPTATDSADPDVLLALADFHRLGAITA